MASVTTMKPFTYDHFIKAVYSLKDDMLMYYIDEAVGIYCRLRGISVGPRPASAKDYSAQYANAFEAANVAIYTVATKIESYNPDKGDFRPYLDTALANALKDIIKSDETGNFFDQTSKKKNKEDEPEKHVKVNIDRFRGATSTDSNSEPDNVDERRDERIRKHMDDALETMIKYIDSMSSMKRAAIYASAFGQILRPDLEGYGRNYADILAQAYNTTALYIRKLATDGKKAALAEARRLGYNEQSMAEVSMGYLQVRKPAPVLDNNDKVIAASSELSPYQQFKLLRHLASNVDESL